MTHPELLTDTDLAKAFGETEKLIGEWRRTYGWPHIKVGKAIRYTPQHVEQIIASHSHGQRSKPKKGAGPRVQIPGQTDRAGRRSA